MYLSEIAVNDFRAFKEAHMELPESGLVLLAGANNAGKTAFLSAFDVIAGDSGDVTSLRHAGVTTPPRVTARFTLSDNERRKILHEAPRSSQLFASGALKWLDYEFAQHEALGAYGLTGMGLIEIRGEFPTAGSVSVARLKLQLPAEPAAIEYLSALNQEMELIAMTEQNFGGGNPQWLDQFIQQTPGLIPLLTPLKEWRPRFYHFRSLRQGTERAQQLASAEKLNPSGNNLAAVLLYLNTDRPDLFTRIEALMTEIVPNIGKLEMRTSRGILRVVFKSMAGDLNLKDLGTGVEQILMTLVVGLMEAAPFTLVAEEPETNLHPAGQRALLGHLQEWAQDRQILAATHSPVMLNWSPGGNRLWHITRSANDSQMSTIEEDPQPLLASLGVRLSDVLSADRLLVLEGPSDQDVLTVWFPEALRNPRVAVLDGKGGDNAIYADRFAEWIAQADRAELRRVLYLRDRDELSIEALDKLRQSPTVRLLARRELENYLLEPSALQTVLNNLLSQSGQAPTENQIGALMLEKADDLRAKIIINRVCRQIGPSQPLVGHRLRQELANSNANEQEIIERVGERLMTAEDLHAQVMEAWDNARQDVAAYAGSALLEIAPGEEILDAIFLHFAGRRYRKRYDGPNIAREMPIPDEIRIIFAEFLDDV